MKENNTGKSVSLNKLLTMTVIIGYVVFLLLLLWMDTILVLNYRKERRNEEKQLVRDYAEALDEHLGRMEELLYDVYAYNEDFRRLSGSLTELEEFDCLYEINYVMRNRVALYQWISGYLLNYHETKEWRYYFDSSAVDTDYVNGMKDFLADRIRNGKDWERLIARYGDQTYCFVFCRRENVSLCGVYDLSKSLLSNAVDLERMGDVCFYADGQVYGASEGMDELAASLVAAAGMADDFENSKGWNEFFGKRVGGTDLWVIYKRPLTIFTFMNVLHMLLFLFTFSTLIVAWFIYKYIKRNIFLPLQKLVETMNEVSRGNWDGIGVHDSRLEEIQRVDAAFHVMVSEIKKQKILSYEQTIEKQKAQMQYLQLQLKPHFYLNGLKMLNMLTIEGDKQRVQDLILRLSYHLRYLLAVNRDLVCLGDEIEYTKNYEKLQSEMMGRSFESRWEIVEAAMQFRVPTLCIQTFVENSFKYAEVVALQKLVISIRVQILETEDGEFLDIIIKDNGRGYPEHILKEINGETEGNGISVGINNIKMRCRLIYGEKAEYSFSNEEGAVSEMVLPCDPGERL